MLPPWLDSVFGRPTPRLTKGLQILRTAFWAVVLFGVAGVATSGRSAQETAPSTAKSLSVKITFLPPPLEGTLSVGVYDRAGKLVRTLHREAPPSEFASTLNGLATQWDGKDDHGTPVPPGKYRVRGFGVADLEVTGEAFHGNDWVSSEDSARPVRFLSLALEGDALALTGLDPVGKAWKFVEPLVEGPSRQEALVLDKSAPDLEPGPTNCPGRAGTRWSLEKVLGEPLVVQLDASGEVNRRLAIGAGEPVPVAIAASTSGDREEVYLLERDGDRWRLRALRRKAPGANASPPWEIFLEKNRWPSNRFSDVAAHVGRSKPFRSEAVISLKTEPNPLLSQPAQTVQLSVGTDADGSFLKSVDGLPLRRLADTPLLKWAVLGHDEQQPDLVLLQSDGAVVEEFRIRHPGKLMSFDAGEYQWPPR
jgi:hypothetical protein